MSIRKSPIPTIMRDISRDRLRALLVEPDGKWQRDAGVSLIEKRHVAAFMRTYKAKQPDFASVRDARFEFRPDLEERLIDSSRPQVRVNLYAAPDAWLDAVLPLAFPSMETMAPLDQAAPETMRLIRHVAGGDECAAAFCNWLAFVVRTGGKARTGWLLQGVLGAGKSLLHSHVLQPLLGIEHVPLRIAQDFEQTYNEWRAKCRVLWLDEFHHKHVRQPTRFMDKMTTTMTSPRAFVWSMRTLNYECSCHSNLILASSRERSLPVSREDNLWNIGEWQPNAFDGPSPAALLSEARRFAGALSVFDFDEVQARTALRNHARNELVKQPGDHFPSFCHRIEDDIHGLVDELLAIDPRHKNRWDVAAAQAVVVKYLLEDAKWGSRSVFRSTEIRLIYHVLYDPAEAVTLQAFNRAMREQGSPPRSRLYNGRRRSGYPVSWDVGAARALIEKHDVLVNAHRANAYEVHEAWREAKYDKPGGPQDYGERTVRTAIERKRR